LRNHLRSRNEKESHPHAALLHATNLKIYEDAITGELLKDPAFVRENPHGIRQVPGFWIDETGEVNLWQNRDYLHPLLLVPYRNPAGKIQACQIRFTGALKPNKKRYLWLSLPKLNSAGSDAPVHYAGWRSFGRKDYFDKPILVTEGALKADVVTRFRPEYFAIANGGISCAQELIVNISRGKKLHLAFDNDYHENPAVLRQLAKLILSCSTSEDLQLISENIKILSWEKQFKGIDDALLKESEIYESSLAEWLSILSVDSGKVIKQIMCEIAQT
jgi:hypothetical protein